MKKKTVGIIGGTGQMGQFFKRFFEKNNCNVLVSSRKTKLKPIECTKQSDVVMISVPIDDTIEVIKEIAPHLRRNSLLIDTTSIKKGPVDAMLRYSSCEVIGMHPVFGPNVPSIKNQTVVLCPARSEKWLKWIFHLLRENNAKIKITTPENHDKMMSIIQGLSHFSTLSVAHAMKNLGIKIEDSLGYTSPVYKLRMMMVGRILNQDADLYANIEMLNPYNQKALEAYLESAKKLKDIIEAGDKKEFLIYFEECAEFFGKFRKEAEEKSDYLIEQMADMEK